jgi:hypothetical protein
MSALERWKERVRLRVVEEDDVAKADGFALALLMGRDRTAEQVEQKLGEECDPWASHDTHTIQGRRLFGKRLALKWLRDEMTADAHAMGLSTEVGEKFVQARAAGRARRTEEPGTK